jgi:predicted transcriptional regulator
MITRFTKQQIFELGRRFVHQKYLSPSDRDEIAHPLGISRAQVSTWFKNRRAKFRRDVKELKSDVQAAKIMDNKQLSQLC